KLVLKYKKYGIMPGASLSELEFEFSLRIDEIDLSGIYENIKKFNNLGIKGSPIKDITFSSFKAAKIMSAFFEIANERELVESIGFPLGNPLFGVRENDTEWA